MSIVYLIGKSNDRDESTGVGSRGADERREFSLFLATLSLEIARHLIDEYIQNNDNNERAPKVRHNENEREDLVRRPGDVALTFEIFIGQREAPAEYGGEKEENGQDPGHGDHDDDLVGRAPVAVLGGHANRTEAVDGDEQNGVDGGQANGVVEREPEVADDLAERPVAEHEIEGEKRHGDEADEKVGDREREDEVVGRVADLSIEEEREHDEQIAAYGYERRRGGQRAQHDLARQRVHLGLDGHRRRG